MADFAIIGGGIVGVMTAREVAAREPGSIITVLERDAIGQGASRRSAGLHWPFGATPRLRAMTAYSQRYYAALAHDDPGLPIHALDAHVHASAADRLRAITLDEANLRKASGNWRVDGCQYADVRGLAEALADALRPQVTFREGTQVTAIDSGPDGVGVELGTGERLYADRVVLTPGPWIAAPAWRNLLAPLRLRIKKIVALHVDLGPDADAGLAVFADDDAFLLPIAEHGYQLFSYTRDEWDVDPDALHGSVSPADIAAGRACLRRHVPELADAAMSGRVFCDAYSPNREPVVRAMDGAGRVVFAGAASGSGYRLAPAIAAEAVDVLTSREGVARDHQYV